MVPSETSHELQTGSCRIFGRRTHGCVSNMLHGTNTATGMRELTLEPLQALSCPSTFSEERRRGPSITVSTPSTLFKQPVEAAACKQPVADQIPKSSVTNEQQADEQRSYVMTRTHAVGNTRYISCVLHACYTYTSTPTFMSPEFDGRLYPERLREMLGASSMKNISC